MDCVPLIIILLVYFSGPVQCSTSASGVGCPIGWVHKAPWCYYVNNQLKITWHQANTECKKRSSILLRVSSPGELKMYTAMMMNYPSPGYWTGLNQLDADGISGTGNWQWGTSFNSDLSNVHWNTEPDYIQGQRCAAINIQARFSSDTCSNMYGAICELRKPRLGCPFGWLFGLTSNCYYITTPGNASQLFSFTGAQQFCKASGAFLITLDIQGDKDYLTKQMNELTWWTTTKWWSGLNDKAQLKTWAWANGDKYTPSYVSWAKEPDDLGGVEFCGAILTTGKFDDRNCSTVANYMCKKPDQLSYGRTDLGCGDFWLRGGRKCYFLAQNNWVNWQTAKQTCVSAQSRLLELQSIDEVNWISQQIDGSLYTWLWTGLTDIKKEGNYVWTDGSLANKKYLHWNHEPNNYGGKEECAMMLKDGHFNDYNCNSKGGFICEYQNTQGQACPTGWTQWTQTGDCYYISRRSPKVLQTWFEAKNWCRLNSKLRKGYLVAINTPKEKAFIVKQLAAIKVGNAYSDGWFTGLTDSRISGFWEFSTGFNNPPNMSLVNWNGQPDDKGHTENCIIIATYGELHDIDCKLKAGYICEYTMGGSSVRADLGILVGVLVSAITTKYFS